MTSIEVLWKQLLKDIYTKGHYHQKDDAEIKEILNVSGFIDNPLDEISSDNVSLKKKHYIDFLRDGVFDIDGYNIKSEALAEYVLALKDKNQIFLSEDDDFVYTYPERLKNYCTIGLWGVRCCLDQLEIMVNRLKENQGSNRAVAVLYNPGLDQKQEHIPCFNWCQALIRDNRLFLSIMFRSNDIYNAFPSNMYFISYIGMTLVEALQKQYPLLKFSGIYYQCSSAHYYTEFDKDVEKIINK